MKRIVVLIFLSILFNNILFAQIDDLDEKYILDNIEKHFIGAYLSIEFLNNLEKTKNYSIAMNHNSNYGHEGFYEKIIVFENYIMYNYPYYDGSSLISKCRLPKYKFDYINETEIIITDPNGHQYLKITSDLENYNVVINNTIGNIVLNDLIVNNYITIEDNIISIPSLDNKEYTICTMGYIYNWNENLIFEDNNSERLVHLNIENNVYTIFWIERNYYTSYREVKRIVWVQQK
jgi:hypothetical protein